MKRTTIIVEEDDNKSTWPAVPAPLQAGESKLDNGWVDGIDVCATCPNRPGGPLNRSGACWCVIPSMYGPNRVTF